MAMRESTLVGPSLCFVGESIGPYEVLRTVLGTDAVVCLEELGGEGESRGGRGGRLLGRTSKAVGARLVGRVGRDEEEGGEGGEEKDREMSEEHLKRVEGRLREPV
jgi:hypothetical protein